MTHFSGERAQIDGSLILPSSRFEGSASQTLGGTTFPITGSDTLHQCQATGFGDAFGVVPLPVWQVTQNVG